MNDPGLFRGIGSCWRHWERGQTDWQSKMKWWLKYNMNIMSSLSRILTDRVFLFELLFINSIPKTQLSRSTDKSRKSPSSYPENKWTPASLIMALTPTNPLSPKPFQFPYHSKARHHSPRPPNPQSPARCPALHKPFQSYDLQTVKLVKSAL